MRPWDWILVAGAVLTIIVVGGAVWLYVATEARWRHIDDTIRGDEP